jgi:hypothetical protein
MSTIKTIAEERFVELKHAQAIIDGLSLWRERLLTQLHRSTQTMRDRARELAKPELDDFDKAFLMVLDDFEEMLRLLAVEPAKCHDRRSL